MRAGAAYCAPAGAQAFGDSPNPDKVTSYSYDLVGNRKTMQDGADSFVYGFDNDFNQLMTVTKNGSTYSSFTYDSNGNQKTEVTDGLTKTFTYDWSDKLVGTKLSKSGYAGSNITNFYSASGQRTRQVVDNITIKYVYDGINLLYTTDDNNIRSNEYVLDTSGAVISAKRQETKFDGKYDFFNYDIRGSVTGIIGSDGKRIVGYTYDEFGKEKVVGDTNYKNDIMFTGAMMDRNSRLYYMNSRFYNSSSGRFISQDSYQGDVFEPWTQHLYVYTGNNPVNFVDPTGHESRPNPRVTDGGGSIPVYPDEPLLVPKKKETKKVKVDKKQNMNKNPKNGFIQLDNEGDGYSIYNNQGNKENWGTPSTLDSLIKLGEEWSKNNSTLLQYGDISLKEGGPFKDHSSHQKGTNVDKRPVRKDGKLQGVNINSAGYSREKTRELIILLLQDPNTSSILFNDKILIEEFKNNKGGVKIRQFKGHDDHLHITFKK